MVFRHKHDATGRETYAQAVIDAIGYSETFDISGKADKATTLAGYGITDAYTIRQAQDFTITALDEGFIDDMSIDNTVDQTYNPNGHYIMHYVDGDGVRHNLFDFSNYFAGKSEIPDISGKFDKSKIVKRATGAQVGLTQDTVFSTQAADDYLQYFLNQYYTALQVSNKIEEWFDGVLSNDPEFEQKLLIDNTVDQTYNPNGHYMMYYIDSELERHNIFDFGVLPMTYVLTAQDKTDIANIVLQLLPNADTMLFPEISEVNNE